MPRSGSDGRSSSSVRRGWCRRTRTSTSARASAPLDSSSMLAGGAAPPGPHVRCAWRAASFDNKGDPARVLWGASFTHAGGVLAWPSVAVFYAGLSRRDSRFDQGTADELRHTVGARLWRQVGFWDSNIEFSVQTGRFGQGRIRAWDVGVDHGIAVGQVGHALWAGRLPSSSLGLRIRTLPTWRRIPISSPVTSCMRRRPVKTCSPS